ncbi:MAG: hypothetical protein GYA55_06310, partial [SAR324 cluster bacterium]|nr:hypothetical protein [SAR324 cluster bacterium]
EELSTLPFAQILDESNESINNEAGEALASFLSNHDVNAEFELSIADDDFERAFSISKLIDEYFSKKSLALGAVKVFVRKDGSREGLELHLKKARPYLNPGGI